MVAPLNKEHWIPALFEHKRAHESWPARMKSLSSEQSLIFQAWALYRLRFILSAEVAGDWDSFGGVIDQLNNLGVILAIATAENVGVALKYFDILHSQLVSHDRSRAVSTDSPAYFRTRNWILNEGSLIFQICHRLPRNHPIMGSRVRNKVLDLFLTARMPGAYRGKAGVRKVGNPPNVDLFFHTTSAHTGAAGTAVKDNPMIPPTAQIPLKKRAPPKDRVIQANRTDPIPPKDKLLPHALLARETSVI